MRGKTRRKWSSINKRKQLEETLRAAEAKYHGIFENAVEGIFQTSVDGRILAANPSIARIFGYGSPEEFIAEVTDVRNLYAFPEERDKFLHLLQRHDSFRNFEAEFNRKDGSIIWLSLSARAIRDSKGRLTGVEGMAVDITRVKRVEEALRESEAKLKDAQAMGRIGSWEFDVETQEITWSDETYKLYNRDPALGPPTAEEEAAYYSQEQALKLGEYARRAIEEGKDFKYDLEARLPGGKHVFFSATMKPIKDAEGRIVRLFGTVQDITDRKRANEELRKSKRLLEITLNSLRDAVFIIKADATEILDCNPAASEIFGYTREEMLRRTTAFLHVDRAALYEFIRQLNLAIEERGFLSQFEFKMKRKDGTIFPTEHSVMPLKDENGKRVGWVSVVRDITERKKTEKALRKAYEELKELSERRVDFTNMAAHELRTPLVPIIGYLEILKEKIEDEKLLDYIEIMMRNAQRQRRLIDRMLELSRIDAGKLELNYSKVNVNELLQMLIDNYAASGSKLLVEVPENLVIHTDMDKLFQILDNLISNAVKYSPLDTAIKICVVTRGGDYLFKVTDQGTGIPKEEQKRIFERFYIVGGKKTTREGRRTGLGLALAKGYVDLLKGKIWVESETGKGSTFYFTIPG